VWLESVVPGLLPTENTATYLGVFRQSSISRRIKKLGEHIVGEMGLRKRSLHSILIIVMNIGSIFKATTLDFPIVT
jgi:hypothetical protein